MTGLESLKVIQREYCAGRLGAEPIRRAVDNTICVYFGNDGRKCAIGAIVPVHLESLFRENNCLSIREELLSTELRKYVQLSQEELEILQQWHDNSVKEERELVSLGSIHTEFYKKLLKMISEKEGQQFVKTVTKWTSAQSSPVVVSTSESVEEILEESIQDMKTSLIPV